MRRWIVLAARLYPHSWRERYGEEFDALVDDATADWRQLLNVTSSAVAMQFSRNKASLKVVGATAIAGAIVAIAASSRVPPRYVSSAVVRMTPEVAAGQTVSPDALQREMGDRFQRLRTYLIARQRDTQRTHSSAKMDRDLGLYVTDERSLWSDLEDPIRHGGEIQVEPEQLPGQNGPALRVSFSYSDGRKAQAVVQKLVALLAQQNDLTAKYKAHHWNAVKSYTLKSGWNPAPSGQFPITVRLDVAEFANLPSVFAERRRSFLVMAGTASGLLLGALAVFFRRRLKLGLRVAVCGLAGCAAAGGLSLFIAERYTASAGFQMSAPRDARDLFGSIPIPPFREEAPKIWNEVLGGDAFWTALRSAQLNLDQSELNALRRERKRFFHMRVTDVGPGISCPFFETTFSHPDKRVAKLMIFELMKALSQRYFVDLQSATGERIVGLVQSTSPDEPRTHYRWQLMLGGAMTGLLLASVKWTAHRTSINGESSLSL